MAIVFGMSMDEKEKEALARFRAAQQRREAGGQGNQPPGPGAPRLAQRERRERTAPREVMPAQGASERDKSHESYTVQPGDTLGGIAQWFYGDSSHWLTIYAANRHLLRDTQEVEAGQVLSIPLHGKRQPLA